MKLNLLSILIYTGVCIFSINQLSAQQYYKVIEGNDNPTTAEQVNDDVKSITDILSVYKIDTSKTIASKENYSFWVAFISNNKLPAKRKEIIYNLLKQMKTELK